MSSFVLRPVDGQAGDGFGGAVAASADGLAIVVGGYRDDVNGNADQGSARAFIWNGTDWVQRGGPITPADGEANDWFARSVHISADGLSIIIGGQGDKVGENAGQGSARVFDWNGSFWQERGIILAPNGAAGDNFGTSVSLSANGLTAVVGDSGDDVGTRTNRGSGWVFDWNGLAWVARGNPNGILDPNGFAQHGFGNAAAISADGKIAIFGASGGNSAQVYAWNGANWVQQGAAIRFGVSEWGTSVDISADGHTILIGGPAEAVNGQAAQGVARVLDWNGSSWVTRGSPITPASGTQFDSHGFSAAMTPDGRSVIIGGPFDDVNSAQDQGSAFVYDWNGTAWVQRGDILTPSDGMADDRFGYSVDLSADGHIAVIGGRLDDAAYTDQGSARVFEWDGARWVEGLVPGAHAAVPDSQSSLGSVLPGGAGHNTYVVRHAGDTMIEVANGGTDQAFVLVDDWTSPSYVETIYLYEQATRVNGGATPEQMVANPLLASTLRGYAGDDTLWGGTADGDVLDGGAGDDILRSGTGITHMIGGAGNDQFVVNNAADTVLELAGEGTDTAWVAVSGWTVGAHIEMVRLLPGVETVALGDTGAQVVSTLAGARITAAGGRNVFYGQGGTDHFIGGDGADIFRAGLGITRMEGGAGDDQYVIYNAASTIIEAANEGSDIAWVAVDGLRVGDNVEVAYLSEGATSIVGGGTRIQLVANHWAASELTAGTGFTTFWGSPFDDILHVGTGGANMYLMNGADRLVFGDHWGLTQVFDFKRSEGDRMDFSGSGLSRADVSVTTLGDRTVLEHAGEQIILYGVTTPLTDADFLF